MIIALLLAFSILAAIGATIWALVTLTRAADALMRQDRNASYWAAMRKMGSVKIK